MRDAQSRPVWKKLAERRIRLSSGEHLLETRTRSSERPVVLALSDPRAYLWRIVGDSHIDISPAFQIPHMPSLVVDMRSGQYIAVNYRLQQGMIVITVSEVSDIVPGLYAVLI